jgi:hypothetical protein
MLAKILVVRAYPRSILSETRVGPREPASENRPLEDSFEND